MPLPIQSLLPRDRISGLMLLTELSARTSQFGTDFIDVKLLDPTGSVSGEYSYGREVRGWAEGWGARHALHPPCIVRVSARVEILFGRPHLFIGGLALYAPIEAEFRDFLPRSTWPWELLWAELRAHLRGETADQERWTLTQAVAPAKPVAILAATNAHRYRQPTPESPKHLENEFLLVPQGTATVYGRLFGQHFGPWPPSFYPSSHLEHRVFPAFFAHYRHVLLTEYLEWIRSLALSDPIEAALRIPTLSNGVRLIQRTSDGSYEICTDAIQLLNPDVAHDDELPVVGVCAADVQAYIRWRSARDGIFYRLPTQHEYSSMWRVVGQETVYGGPYRPEPFALVSPGKRRPYAAPGDVGPYGHRDLIGSVEDLCVRTDLHSIERYGNYASSRGSTFHLLNGGRHDNLGFRLVFDPKARILRRQNARRGLFTVQFVAR